MLKLSKYNCLHTSGNHTILYNALSKIILIMDDNFDLTYLQKETTQNSPVQRFLLEHHFLLRPEINEQMLANLYTMDTTNSNDLQIMILPTTDCNFQCAYCYENLDSCTMNTKVQQQLKLFFKRQIPLYASLHIEWFGGEPLLTKNMIYELSESIEEICHRSGKIFNASITTNAYLLDLETFQNLLKHHVYTYSITIDGPAFIHDHLRGCKDGKGSFDRIIKNLIEIKDKVNVQYFTIVIKVNVTRSLLEVFDDFLAYLKDIFDEDSRFTFMFRIVGDFGVDDIEQIQQELLGEPDIIYDYLLRSHTTLDYRAHYALLTNHICSAAKRNAYTISSDGFIYKCASLLENDKSQIGSLGKNGEFIIDRAKMSQWIGNRCDCKTFDSCSFAPSCNTCPAKEITMNNNQPCIMKNGRMGKILELLTRDKDTRSYDFVYKLKEGEIVRC